MRAERREILRATVFACRTPLDVPRIISGWAALRATAAAALLPDTMAVSTY